MINIPSAIMISQPDSARAEAFGKSVVSAAARMGFQIEEKRDMFTHSEAESTLIWINLDESNTDRPTWLPDLLRRHSESNILLSSLATDSTYRSSICEYAHNSPAVKRWMIVSHEKPSGDISNLVGEKLIWLGSFPALKEESSNIYSNEQLADYRLAKIISRSLYGSELPLDSPVGMPLKAMVEIVRACNIRCPACPVGNKSAHLYPNMNISLFEHIVRQLVPTVWHIALYNYGEPLLHPNVAKFVQGAKLAGIEKVEIATNGVLIPEGTHEALVDAGLDIIRFSIDGMTEETYRAYRVGGSLEKVWNNVRLFKAAKDKLASRLPIIEAQMVINKYNETEKDAFAGKAYNMGADKIRFKTFNAMMSGTESLIIGRNFLPNDQTLSRYKNYDNLDLHVSEEPSRCIWPWERIVINADGTIVPCCYDYNGDYPLGVFDSTSKTSINEWWSTLERKKFRDMITRGQVEMCERCPSGGRRLLSL